MLVNLFKYENKAYAKKFVPLLIFFFVLSCIATLLNIIPNPSYSGGSLNFIQTLFQFAVYVGIVIFMVITVLICAQRFTNHLFGDEGYLTLTLPVPSWMHLLVKSATATLWSLFGAFVVFVSTMIFSEKSINIPKIIGELYESITYYASNIEVPSFIYFLITLIQMFVVCMAVYMFLYLGLTFSHSFAKSRLIATVGILILLIFLFVYVIRFYEYIIWDVFYYNMVGQTSTSSISTDRISLFILPVYYAVVGLLAFFATNRLLKSRIDLV